MKNLLIIVLGFLPHFIFPETNTSGIINSDTIWSLSDSPYNITGDLVIINSSTLTIEAGVIINFTGDFKILVNQGSIISNGTESSPITFNGNSIVGDQRMILYKNSDLSDSSFYYSNFIGPQESIPLERIRNYSYV